MDPRPSVLIVDQSPDSREVLRTVLEHRGVKILEASGADQGLELARRHQPDLIVVDLELDNSCPGTIRREFARQSEVLETPLVLLGSVRRGGGEAGQFIAKPYHYGPLIRKIEELLQIQQPAAHGC